MGLPPPSYDWAMARSVEELEHEGVGEAVVALTEEARKVVLEAKAAEPEPETLALWLEVRGVQGGNFAYDLYFQALVDAADEDSVVVDDDLAVVVPAASVDRLRAHASSGRRRARAGWPS